MGLLYERRRPIPYAGMPRKSAPLSGMIQCRCECRAGSLGAKHPSRCGRKEEKKKKKEGREKGKNTRASENKSNPGSVGVSPLTRSNRNEWPRERVEGTTDTGMDTTSGSYVIHGILFERRRGRNLFFDGRSFTEIGPK